MTFRNTLLKSAAVALVTPIFFSQAHAGSVLVTIADAGVSASALSNTDVFDFNDLNTGFNYDVGINGVGSIDQVYVSNPNVWGGAVDTNTGSASKFSWVGTPGSATSVVSLTSPSSYFGFWWSAGDASNQLSFYDGTDLVAQYATDSVMNNAALNTNYYGNPLGGGNSSQPYAFINFFGDDGTTWDSVEFTTVSGNNGFESDNYTTRIESFSPLSDDASDTGTAISEVSGTDTTVVDETITERWEWAQTAPGAPTPPIYGLIIFCTLVAMKDKLKARTS